MQACVRAIALGVFVLARMAHAVPSGYENWSAADKAKYIYKQVEATEYERVPSVNWLTCRQILGMRALFSLRKSFVHTGDEMPQGRAKFIHPYGSVGIVRLVLNSQKYTGMFSAGEVIGVARLSLAAPPAVAGFTPGMALKLPVKGAPSVDLHVMPGIDGQGANHFYFARPFTSTIGVPEKWGTYLLGEWFKRTVSTPNVLSLEHMAKFTPNGKVDGPVRAPASIAFEPFGAIPGSAESKNDFRDDLAAISPGTLLFKLVAVDADGSREPVGSLYLQTVLVPSVYGDEQLFFRHEHPEAQP